MDDVTELGRYLNAGEKLRMRRLMVTVPLIPCLLAAAVYVVALRWLPPVWVSHIGGQGELTYTPPLAAGHRGTE